MGPDAIAKGSSVREPGEPLCRSCSAHRSKMLRELDAIPSKLDLIVALRMRGLPNVPRATSKEARY